MKDKIIAKMEAHVKSIVEKPIITNEDYMLIAGYLSKLQFEEQEEERKKSLAESSELLKNAMSLIGGAF